MLTFVATRFYWKKQYKKDISIYWPSYRFLRSSLREVSWISQIWIDNKFGVNIKIFFIIKIVCNNLKMQLDSEEYYICTKT